MDTKDLRQEYESIKDQAESLRSSVVREIQKSLDGNGISLGVPLESRVKTWESIEEKLVRKDYNINSVLRLPDLVGIRIVLLFLPDVQLAFDAVKASFKVIKPNKSPKKQDSSKFGYQSRHLDVKIPKTWTDIPTMKGLENITIEIQIKTLAQHIWAATSHKLQYKQEKDNPIEVNRAIYRLSAVLEIVDSELERVLQEKVAYKEFAKKNPKPTDALNVDLIEIVLDKIYPHKNKSLNETFSLLLQQLNNYKITTVEQLEKLASAHVDYLLKVQNDHETESKLPNYSLHPEVMRMGPDFSYSGLVRKSMTLDHRNKKKSGPVIPVDE